MQQLKTAICLIGFAVLALDVNARADLLAHYTFEGNVNDSSGNGYNGTAVGGATYGPGVNGSGALVLDGSTGYASIPFADPLTLASSSYTLSFDINLASAASLQTFLSGFDNQADYNGGYSEALYNNGFLSIHNSGGGGMSYNFSSVDPANYVNQWKLYTLVYDSAAQTRTLYVDGTSVAQVSTTADLVDRGSGSLLIGALHNADVGYFGFLDGSIADVRIYNNALSANDVEAIETMDTATPEPTSIALVGVPAMGMLLHRRRSRKDATLADV